MLARILRRVSVGMRMPIKARPRVKTARCQRPSVAWKLRSQAQCGARLVLAPVPVQIRSKYWHSREWPPRKTGGPPAQRRVTETRGSAPTTAGKGAAKAAVKARHPVSGASASRRSVLSRRRLTQAMRRAAGKVVSAAEDVVAVAVAVEGVGADACQRRGRGRGHGSDDALEASPAAKHSSF